MCLNPHRDAYLNPHRDTLLHYYQAPYQVVGIVGGEAINAKPDQLSRLGLVHSRLILKQDIDLSHTIRMCDVLVQNGEICVQVVKS